MSNERRNNQGIVFIGAERSGKSYMSKVLMNQMYLNLGSIPFVYNFGMDTDFPSNEFSEIEFLEVSEHRKYMGKRDYDSFSKSNTIEFFRLNSLSESMMNKGLSEGSIYRFDDLSKMFKGSKIRAWRLMDSKSERRLYNSFSNYLSDCVLLIDDCRPIYRYGMKSEHINVYARKNHLGKKSRYFKETGITGIDILSIFHSIDLVSPEIITYSNSLVFFETSNRPSLKNVEDDNLKNSIIEVWDKLKRSPKYTAYSIGLKGDDYLNIKKIQ